MYDELVKRLREEASSWCINCCYRAGDCICAAPDDREKDCDICSKLQAADAIEELSKPKWISVEDALPEEDVDVLIADRYKGGEGDTSHVDIDITTYGQMYFGGREVAGVKHWRPPFEYFSSNYEVIAWMPLPEPPKEEA